MNYCYAVSVVGIVVVDDKNQIVGESPFRTIEEFQNHQKTISQLKKKYPPIQPLPPERLPLVLPQLKNKKHFPLFYLNNLQLTKQALRSSVDDDDFITQAMSSIEELDKINNTLAKRLREWYGLYLPELSQRVADHEKFVELVTQKEKKEWLKEWHISESMGADLAPIHIQEMTRLAQETVRMHALRKAQEAYLASVMKTYCPNLLELAGPTIGGKLVQLAKGLRRLAELPSSTVQLLGAERALFRHLKTKSPSPKHGIIVNHPFIQKAKSDKRGKAARALADRLSFCARLDFFKGEFKAPQYKKELEKMFTNESLGIR